jgi:hypothetical protein
MSRNGSTLAMAIGGWMSGAIYDLTGSYRAAFLNGIAWNLPNMPVAFWLLLGRLRPRAGAGVIEEYKATRPRSFAFAGCSGLVRFEPRSRLISMSCE